MKESYREAPVCASPQDTRRTSWIYRQLPQFLSFHFMICVYQVQAPWKELQNFLWIPLNVAGCCCCGVADRLIPKPPLKILTTGFLRILKNAINAEVRRCCMCDYSNIFSFLLTHRHKHPNTCIINKGGLSKWEKYKCQMVKRKTWRNAVFLLQDWKYEMGEDISRMSWVLYPQHVSFSCCMSSCVQASDKGQHTLRL